ncbi:MAG: Uncharacterised protein [Flavobacteriales bacterium UBA4585]|nr:MAG: Uncharacterised protein [Flavobacteriales bacterium UBA4585]
MSNNTHVISLDEAKQMTHAYQSAAQFQGLTVASMIDKEAYQLVINQPNCVNIRTYFGLNSEEKLTIVIVGVDANGEDMTDGVLLNMATNCPIFCPNNSELMK